jgi:hypothetical protein
MGKVIYSMSVSLDGFVETPSRSLDWVLVDDELHKPVGLRWLETRTFDSGVVHLRYEAVDTAG